MNTDPKENNRTAVRTIRPPSKVLGITTFGGRVIVACEGGVYELAGDELVPFRFLMPDQCSVASELVMHRPGSFGKSVVP